MNNYQSTTTSLVSPSSTEVPNSTYHHFFRYKSPPSSRSLTAYDKSLNIKSKLSPRSSKYNSPLTPPASLPKPISITNRSRKQSFNLASSPTSTNQPQFDSPLSSPIPFLLQSSSAPSPYSTYSHSASSSSSSSPSSHYHHAQLRRLSQISSPPIPVKESSNGRLSQDGLADGQRQLNQYLLIKSIGKGSYGSVELARDVTSNQLYAVKEYSKKQMRKRALKSSSHRRRQNIPQDPLGNSTPSDGIQLVKAEVAIMKKLSHTNIVCLHEVIDTETDSLFFVLELCPYGPVMQIGNGTTVKPLSEQSARNIFRQLILGIEYLHFHEIIHRDIKPDNILYYEDPKAAFDPLCKIVDFGISESFSKPGDDTMHKSAGSPAFLAPEMCKGSTEGVHGRMTDIWAMGVTLYALVCGRLPFEDDSPIGLYEKILEETPYVPVHKISEPLVELLTSLLNKSPTSRMEMEKLKVSRWVTEEGKDPLEEQCGYLLPMEPPTDREIAEAFKSFKAVATIFRAIGKFRKRNSSSQSTSNSQPDADTNKSMVRSASIRSDEPASLAHLSQILDSPQSYPMNISPRPTIEASRGASLSDWARSSSFSSKLSRSDSTGQLLPSIAADISSNATTTLDKPISTKPNDSDQLDHSQNHKFFVEDYDQVDLPITNELGLDTAIDSLTLLGI